MRQEVSEEGQEDWVGEAEGNEDGEEGAAGGAQQQQRRRGGGSQGRKRGRGAGGRDSDGDEDMEDGGDAEAAAAARSQRAARRGGGPLSPSDWQAVGRAMHAGQAARQRAGEPTGELSLGELREQLAGLGVAAEEGPLAALLAAASDAFGDMDSAEAGKYASCMPNFMWLAEDKLISFMS
jgi:hypothetical protein